MDEQETASDRDSNASETPVDATPAAGRRRRGALSFVVVFLVVTVILLALGRYAVNTRFMNWYLYQVAHNTSAILNIIGYSSHLEDLTMYQDRSADVRAELDAWRNGDDASEQPNRPHDSGPLTSYEIWQYRSMLLARQAAYTDAMIELLESQTKPVAASDQERITQLRAALDRLKESTRYEGPNGTMQAMPPEMGALVQSCEETLRALEQGQRPDNVPLSDVLDQLDKQIAAGVERQRAYLKNRAVQLSIQIHDRHGPTVDFIAKAGLTTQLRESEEELNRVEQNTALSASERKAQAQKLQQQVKNLKTARERADKQRDTEADMDKRFRFNVVPDCGALPSMSIFFAAMLAFPTDFRKRLLGLAIGLPLLYGINIARLTCLALIGAYTGNGRIFEFAHEYVWQAVYIVFVVIIWLMWVEFIVRPGRNNQ